MTNNLILYKQTNLICRVRQRSLENGEDERRVGRRPVAGKKPGHGRLVQEEEDADRIDVEEFRKRHW
jgi:hypothetical protein